MRREALHRELHAHGRKVRYETTTLAGSTIGSILALFFIHTYMGCTNKEDNTQRSSMYHTQHDPTEIDEPNVPLYGFPLHCLRGKEPKNV